MHRLMVSCVLLSVLGVPGCHRPDVVPSSQQTFTGTPALSPHTPSAQPAGDSRRHVIIDTDMALDDWPAILYLLNRHDVRILAITVTGAGEAHCSTGIRNLLDLLALAGRMEGGIPIACGDDEPMDGYHTFPDAWRRKADTLYGVAIPHATFTPPPHHAVQLLRQSLHEARKPVTILTLGPLTNIAQLLEQDPGLQDKLGELVMMGGAVRVRGNLIVPGVTEHITNTVAEWNIYVDPLAARHVFRSGVPIVLVPLDATNQVPITRRFTADFKQLAQSKEAHFLDAIFDQTKVFIESGELYFWDPLAAAVLADRDLCQYESLRLDVVVAYSEVPSPTEHGFSATRTDGEPRRHFDESVTGQTIVSDNGVPIQVCTEVDAARFQQDFLRTINHEPASEADRHRSHPPGIHRLSNPHPSR